MEIMKGKKERSEEQRQPYLMWLSKVPDREKGANGEEETIKQIIEERPMFLDRRGILNPRKDQWEKTHASGHSEKCQISKGNENKTSWNVPDRKYKLPKKEKKKNEPGFSLLICNTRNQTGITPTDYWKKGLYPKNSVHQQALPHFSG